MLMPTSLGLALQVFPSHQRGTAVGIWAGVGAMAAGSGPVLGGLLVESSWRWIFLINLPIIVAALAAGAAILPRRDAAPSGPRTGRRTDLAGDHDRVRLPNVAQGNAFTVGHRRPPPGRC